MAGLTSDGSSLCQGPEIALSMFTCPKVRIEGCHAGGWSVTHMIPLHSSTICRPHKGKCSRTHADQTKGSRYNVADRGQVGKI